ncbi:ATP-binding protein [Thermophagus sp. OGC60D27]|uniref:ATP-binding protein n=1 Tax=Thermophagus sp. OGC60D27 TaxID=3458415 RepID=UPI0040376A5E
MVRINKISRKIAWSLGLTWNYSDRIRTLRDLVENRERFQVLINATPDIICFKDAKGRWIEANESSKKLFRLEGKNFLMKSDEQLKEMVPELAEVFDQCMETDREAWRKKDTVMSEEIIPLVNGAYRVYDIIKNPVFDKSGNRKGIVVLGRDITDRKKAEEMLRESEERFRIVATHASDIIFEWDPFSDVMKWYGREEVFEKFNPAPRNFSEFIDMVYLDDRERILHFWKEKLAKKEEWKDEFRVYSKERKLKYYRSCGIMVFKNGKPYKVFGTLADVTHQKELIDNLREAVEVAQYNQARLTGLLSVIPDLILVFDKQGIIKDYHAESVSSLYVPPEAFVDQPVEKVLPPQIATLTLDKINQVMAHKSVETYEYELSDNNGSGIFEARMVFVDEERVMVIIRNVTYERKVEQELIKAKEQAEESDRLKSAFLANLSHEIRTPMNGIIGFSELLRNENLQKEEKESYINTIVSSGHQLLSIIDDVLEISQLETRQIHLLPDRINLNRLVVDLARFFSIEAKQKSVNLQYRLPDEEHFVVADGGRITQIFNNLIGNAFKFTQQGGFIEFGFEPMGDFIRFFVIDDGIGIEPAHHHIIFERFGQVPTTGASQKKGTGLGLSISKSLVELMGGRIWVESTPGHGASFFFTIPVTQK